MLSIKIEISSQNRFKWPLDFFMSTVRHLPGNLPLTKTSEQSESTAVLQGFWYDVNALLRLYFCMRPSV